MTKEELAKEIDIYMKRIIDVNDYFMLYKNMLIISNNNLEQTDKISSFIYVVTNSLLTSTLNELVLLIDQREDKNIINLVNVCMQNKQLFRTELHEQYEDVKTKKIEKIFVKDIDIKKEIKECQNIILKHSNKIKDFKTMRDKVLSHVDKEYFYNRNHISKEINLQNQDIEDILNDLLFIVNRLSSLLSGQIYAYNDEYIDEFKYIVDSLE